MTTAELLNIIERLQSQIDALAFRVRSLEASIRDDCLMRLPAEAGLVETNSVAMVDIPAFLRRMAD